MSSVPFMQMYWADYFGKTGHLTCEQHGAYLLLLGQMWTGGGTLPNDAAKLARLARCTPARWAKVAPEILSFFEVEGTVLTNKRLTNELEKAREKSIKRADAGKRGGDAKALKDKEPALANATPNAVALPCHSPEPEPETEKKEETKVSSSTRRKRRADPSVIDLEFEAAWRAYPHVRGRSPKPDALAEWRAMSPGHRAALVGACKRYAADGREPKEDCGAPAMHRWLRGQRFLDWMEPETPPPKVLTPAEQAAQAAKNAAYLDMLESRANAGT